MSRVKTWLLFCAPITNSSGVETWNQVFADFDGYGGYAVVQATIDNGYVIATAGSDGKTDITLIKTDTADYKRGANTFKRFAYFFKWPTFFFTGRVG